MGTTQKDHSFKTNLDDRESWKQNFISVYENQVYCNKSKLIIVTEKHHKGG